MNEDFPLELEKLMRSAGTRIMSDIIRRLRDCSEITRTADWQIDRLNQLGESKKYIKSTIQKALKLSDEQIEEMYKNAAGSAHAYNKELYKATGKDYIPYAENAFLQQITAAAAAQTKDEFKNITGSLGFAVKRGGLTVFKPIAKYYQSTLDNAVADITSGAFDYNTVIKRTVEEMTRSGLRTVDYASGHSNRIDVAVRRAVLTGLNQLTGQVQEANAEKLGAEKFEVTWHSTARPTHQPWQGRVYTKEELVSVCGLGEVDGLKGANCRHDYFPFIEGISERVYTDEQLEEMNRKENEKKAYGDKEYTAYEATQRQRYLETAIRAQRQKIKLLQEGNASEDDIISAKCKYQKLSREYTSFSKAMDLPQERSRIYSDGLGKVDVKLPKEKQAVAKTPNTHFSEGNPKISKIEALQTKRKEQENKTDVSGENTDKADNEQISVENSEKGGIIEQKSNREVREWYVSEVSNILNTIDEMLPLEEKAKQAFEKRNQIRSRAREMMADKEMKEFLETEKPNMTFEDLIASKMERKGLTREEALMDILKTATKTNKSVNNELGLDGD